MVSVPYNILIDYLDIGALVNDLKLKVAKVSGPEIICHCAMPDHNDSNPSMHINRFKGTFHCFGCRVKGNLLTLITIVKGLEFPENKIYLEEFTSIKNKSISEIIDLVEEKANNDTSQSNIIVGGFDRFNLDYNTELMNDIALKPVYYPMGTDFWSTEVYEWCEKALIDYNKVKQYFNLGFCRIGKYNNRIIIPVWFKGKLTNFQARDVTGNADSKDLYIYGIPVGSTLFNYDNINWEYPVVIVEGCIDVLRLWPYNTNIVAVFGNYLSDGQVLLLQNAKTIIVMPDKDKGGQVLLQSVRDKLKDREIWLRFFDKKDIPNLLNKVVKINGK